jgi:hypothetical protein
MRLTVLPLHAIITLRLEGDEEGLRDGNMQSDDWVLFGQTNVIHECTRR